MLSSTNDPTGDASIEKRREKLEQLCKLTRLENNLECISLKCWHISSPYLITRWAGQRQCTVSTAVNM